MECIYLVKRQKSNPSYLQSLCGFWMIVAMLPRSYQEKHASRPNLPPKNETSSAYHCRVSKGTIKATGFITFGALPLAMFGRIRALGYMEQLLYHGFWSTQRQLNPIIPCKHWRSTNQSSWLYNIYIYIFCGILAEMSLTSRRSLYYWWRQWIDLAFSLRPSIRPSIRLSVYPSVHPPLRASVRLSVRPYERSDLVNHTSYRLQAKFQMCSWVYLTIFSVSFQTLLTILLIISD